MMVAYVYGSLIRCFKAVSWSKYTHTYGVHVCPGGCSGGGRGLGFLRALGLRGQGIKAISNYNESHYCPRMIMC